MPDELSELQENAEHGRENPSLAPISVTMAILAVCVAVVSLMGHRAHTEELMLQKQATGFENESAREQRRANRFDLGEVFLEIALVISSLALLSRKRFYWFLGIVSGLAGLGVAVTG